MAKIPPSIFAGRSASILLAFFWCDSDARTMLPKPTRRGTFAVGMRRRSYEVDGGVVPRNCAGHGMPCPNDGEHARAILMATRRGGFRYTPAGCWRYETAAGA
jgi:hypothetical protein